METLIKCPCGRIAALRGARNLDICFYMPRFLRSVRLALHPAQTINQCFLKAHPERTHASVFRNERSAEIYLRALIFAVKLRRIFTGGQESGAAAYSTVRQATLTSPSGKKTSKKPQILTLASINLSKKFDYIKPVFRAQQVFGNWIWI
jgi:hypothetical protein